MKLLPLLLFFALMSTRILNALKIPDNDGMVAQNADARISASMSAGC